MFSRFRLCSVCLTAILVSLSLRPTAAAERPNLIFIIADDCTYRDMQVYGGQARTPHLNQLAKEGLQFSRCFQTAPMCSPTRHNIYTGIYPVRSGAWPNHTRVYDGTRSIVHYLKDVGYRVALSGKTHINPRDSFPFEYDDEFKSGKVDADNPYPAIDRLMTESVAADTPFCLFACSNEPHTPWNKGDASAYSPESLELPPSWVDTPITRDAYAAYLAEITYFDAQCGKLLELLDRHKLQSDTLVMVVSEQGSSFPFAKWTCYEQGLASGMIVRWPGHVAAGSTTDALVEYCDVAPTFLEAAGAQVPDTMDGRSFLAVLEGRADEHKQYTFGIHTTRGIINGSDHFGIRSCGTKTHRYIRNLHPDTEFTNAVTRVGKGNENFWASWKAKADAGDPHAVAMTHRYSFRPAEELYDVVNDPHCLHNLIDDRQLASVKAELSAQLDAWMADQGDRGHDTEAAAMTRQRKGPKKSGAQKKKRKSK